MGYLLCQTQWNSKQTHKHLQQLHRKNWWLNSAREKENNSLYSYRDHESSRFNKWKRNWNDCSYHCWWKEIFLVWGEKKNINKKNTIPDNIASLGCVATAKQWFYGFGNFPNKQKNASVRTEALLAKNIVCATTI